MVALVVVSFLGVASGIRGRASEMPLDLIEFGDISRLALFLLPSLIYYVVPITFLLGIMMTFGRLAEQGEITAMKAAGIPLKRVIAPVIVGGTLLSVACFLVQDRVQPWAMTKFFDIIGSELPKRMTMDALPAGVMHEVGGWRVYFGSKDSETLTLNDIVLIQEDEEGVTTTYHADSARYVKDEKGHRIVLGKGGFVSESGRGEFARITKPVEPPGTKKVRGARRMLSLAGLVESERELTAAYEETGTKSAKDALEKERREIGERIGFPLAAFAVAFVAAPLGVRARRSGRSYTFAMGFGIILAYYVLMVLTESSSLKSVSTNIVNASIPNMVLFVAGLYLIWRVDRI